MSRINSHALPTQKNGTHQSFDFYATTCSILEIGNIFSKADIFIRLFLVLFVIRQIMDFSWGYPLHNHHSAKEKNAELQRNFNEKLRRRWDSWVSNPWDDRIWGKRRRDGRPKSVMSSTLQKSGSWSTSSLFNLVTKRSFLWHWIETKE